MTGFRERKTWIVFIAVLLLFAACKGETPTAPPSGGGTPPGTSPPPTGVNVVVTVSNANPVVDSSVVVTATVTDGGQPVANGTAVEFETTGGVLDGVGTAVLKTTANGVASVTLTSGTAGAVSVRVTVNNVSRQAAVNFVARPVTPTPPNLTPSITSVTPSIGRPAGGEIIRIAGTNFRTPVKVLFRLPNQAVPTEATVVSVTETAIEVITPGVNLGAGQQVAADIIVITQAGTTTENRVERTGGFTFRNETLTPTLFSITPNSGPVIGGTRVTLVGDGFQEPVQVLFDTAEARVLTVKFDEIIVETPAGRDTAPTGSGAVTGPVPVTVRNLNSQTAVTLPAAFHYKNAMQITGVTVSGARVTIEGTGFVSPVIVAVQTGNGDIGLGVISVTGSKIVATVPTLIPQACGPGPEGPIVVANIVNGDQATGPTFQFPAIVPSIVNINPNTVVVGTDTSFAVTVADAVPGTTRFTVGGKTLFPTSAVDNGNGTITFAVPVPTNLTFPTVACPTGGERLGPLDVDVVYDSSVNGCDDTAAGALTVRPADETCVAPPAVLSTTPTGGTCALVAGTPSATDPATGTATITVTNAAAAGSQSLVVTSVTPSNAVNGAVTSISPTNVTLAPGASRSFTITFNPAAAGAFGADITFATNVGDSTVCISGTAAP
jgi:hypothetical protein